MDTRGDGVEDELDELDEIEVARLVGEDRPDVRSPAGTLDPFSVERRALLATALVPSMFPTTTDELLAAIEDAELPLDLVEALGGLPARGFENVQDIWVAIGGPVEERDTGGAPEASQPTRAGRPLAATAPAREVRAERGAGHGRLHLDTAPLKRGAGFALRLVRGAAALPVAASATALTVSSAAMQRASEQLSGVAAHIAGSRG